MTSYKAFSQADTKREDFKKYLEKSGALEALTKALVSLFEEPERPQDAVQYLQLHLRMPAQVAELDELKEEIVKLKLQVDGLKSENEELKEKIQQCENQGSPKEE